MTGYPLYRKPIVPDDGIPNDYVVCLDCTVSVKDELVALATHNLFHLNILDKEERTLGTQRYIDSGEYGGEYGED